MGVVQHVVTVLMLTAHLGLAVPVTQETRYHDDGGRKCRLCPPGEYQASCAECKPCSSGSYTSDWNTEFKCHYCYRDCRADLHLKEIQMCNSTADTRCGCESGFRCTREESIGNCRNCVKIRETTTATTETVTPDWSPTSPEHSSTSSRPCSSPPCGPQLHTPERNSTSNTADKRSRELAAILCPVIAIGCIMALVLLFCAHRPGDGMCFKLAILRLCKEGGRDASAHKTKESIHQFPRDTSSAKHQPLPLAASLGPVHVHNPGTVVFSLLSQFTGQADLTREEKTGETASSEEGEERDCPVFHPTPSPCIHLSEEERSGETDRVFFPSQEQGKDCHMSKEEAL